MGAEDALLFASFTLSLRHLHAWDTLGHFERRVPLDGTLQVSRLISLCLTAVLEGDATDRIEKKK